jgi:hypothetical protein
LEPPERREFEDLDLEEAEEGDGHAPIGGGGKVEEAVDADEAVELIDFFGLFSNVDFGGPGEEEAEEADC